MLVFIARRVGAFCLALALFAMCDSLAAQTFIQKVENKALKGAAYSRLRNLTYQQCEQRCLQDARCVAIEHYRGGGVLRRASNCALFSSVEQSADAKHSDVGYKRRSVAVAPGAPAIRPRAGGAPPRPQDEFARHYRRPSPPAAATAPKSPSDRPARELTPEALARQRQALERQIAEVEERRRTLEAETRRLEASRQARQAQERAAAGRSRAAETIPPAPPRSVPVPESAARSIRGPSAAPPVGGSAPSIANRPAAAPTDARPAALDAQTEPSDRFHIVPVFYGTDRNRIKLETRIGYANDRAKRLEMGRALVSVPLDHKVPNIERPRAWTIPYLGTIQLEKEDPNKHFTVREMKVLTKEELLALVKQRLGASRTFRDQSIVFIHGYNMSFDDALFRTAQISYDLQFDGAAFAYSWPSGGGLASYIYDRDSAQGAERFLYEFLQMVQNETGSENINIIAHSMGNQMLLQVLRSLKLRAPQAVSRINQIILAAPDVDRDAFEAIAAEVTGIANGITLYASANDRALEASRFVAGNKPRAGDVPSGGPVIVSGIDTIDISRLSTGYLALHHSGYAEHSDLLTDIGQIIRAGTRPWSLRLKAYRPVTLQAGTYWRYED